jgi:hypothetical protein
MRFILSAFPLLVLAGCIGLVVPPDEPELFDAALPVDSDAGPGGADPGLHDAGLHDAGLHDAGLHDAGLHDAGLPDAELHDAGLHDAGLPDAGLHDAGLLDAGLRDAGLPDAGLHDAGLPDAGPLDAGVGPTGPRCMVFLHWRGGAANAVVQRGNYSIAWPGGNQPYPPGRAWYYFPQVEYASMIAGIKASIPPSCGRIILKGFSNGAAAASKIYCSGETFGGRLIGVVSDDPVMDEGTLNCTPPLGVPAVVYYTGGLQAGPYNCSTNGYICQGGVVVSNNAYISRMGPQAQLLHSDQNSHNCYGNDCRALTPESIGWW